MNVTGLLSVLAITSALSTSAFAACSEHPIQHDWGTKTGDTRVSGDFVKETVFGKKVRYESGTEHYRKNGSYQFTRGTEKFNPEGYVFYPDGSRCLNYPEDPRYDLYVVRDQKLVLINMRGGRFTARITR